MAYMMLDEAQYIGYVLYRSVRLFFKCSFNARFCAGNAVRSVIENFSGGRISVIKGAFYEYG